MKELIGDFWATPADWKCVTTNGCYRPDGTAIMGAGVALDMAKRYPDAPGILGELLRDRGNHVYRLLVERIEPGKDWRAYYSFPTKHHPSAPSPLALIVQSCQEIRAHWKLASYDLAAPPTVLIPRPGCGHGGLDWEDVRPVIEPLLPEDNWLIIDRPARRKARPVNY